MILFLARSSAIFEGDFNQSSDCSSGHMTSWCCTRYWKQTSNCKRTSPASLSYPGMMCKNDNLLWNILTFIRFKNTISFSKIFCWFRCSRFGLDGAVLGATNCTLMHVAGPHVYDGLQSLWRNYGNQKPRALNVGFGIYEGSRGFRQVFVIQQDTVSGPNVGSIASSWTTNRVGVCISTTNTVPILTQKKLKYPARPRT